MKVGINGAGRIGKIVARVALERGIEIGCINDPFVTAEYFAYLLGRDSTHGSLLRKAKIRSEGESVVIEQEGRVTKIPITSEKVPSSVGWDKYGVDYVVESSGIFKTVKDCEGHLAPGVKSVVITAPSPDAPMFVVGVNCLSYNGERVVSNASCTTNCLAPLAKVLHDKFGIENGLMTTVHALTATQRIVDGMSVKAFRDGRSGVQNIIPASTGAAAAIGKVIPELQGKLTGMAFRVPVPDVSVVDLTVTLKTGAKPEEIKAALKNASETDLSGILGYTEDPVVSSDFIGEKLSSVFDASASIFLTDTFVKLIAWYDNEYGYSQRVVDLIKRMESFHAR